jgi:1-acyl-sn-glycerol-3-phosphate acyltransferase
MRTLYFYLRFIFSLIRRIPLQISYQKAALAGKDGVDDKIWKSVCSWGGQRIADTGATINVYGLENIPDCKGILYIANHQSNMDIPLLISKIPGSKGFIAKTELSKIPLLSNWMSLIHCLYMDRNDIKQSTKIIIEGIKQLKAGINMVVFPEGTRSKGGAPHEFKAGSFKLATKSKAVIVPVTIDGTFKLMEANGNKIRPATVNLYIHEPIITAELTKDELTALPQRVESIVLGALPNYEDKN